MTFEEEIATVINRHSREGDSNTPDFILAQYLHDCLRAWNSASNNRERWYGVRHSPAIADAIAKETKS